MKINRKILIYSFLVLSVVLVACNDNESSSQEVTANSNASSEHQSSEPVENSTEPTDNSTTEVGTAYENNSPEPNDDISNPELRQLTDNQVALHIDDEIFPVTLYNNATADDLLTQLPLTIDASDYAGYDEKLLRLDDGLSMENAPKGDNPMVPEIGYYEPGEWIALYYGPIGYWDGKVPLGQIDASPEELEAIPEGSEVTIDVYEDD